MLGFYIINELFDISCISDHVQPISKPLSVVLAECSHFVVTWSVQEYSCVNLVCLNVPQKCYEFKTNTELLKTCVNALK